MMFKNSILSLLLILIHITAFSQWYEVNSNVTKTLTNIKFIDNNIGYCIGEDGVIIKSTDGGENWTDISFSTKSFRQMYFVDTLTGIITDDSTIYKTVDGNNFVDISNNFTLNNYDLVIQSISFKNQFGIIKIRYVNPNNVLDVLYKSFKSFNFGDTWQEINDIYPNEFYYVLDSITYYSVGFNLHKTIDGGTNWDTIQNINFSFPPSQETFIIFPNNTGVATVVYTYEYAVFDLNTKTLSQSATGWYRSFDFISNKGFYLNGGFTGNNNLFVSHDYGVTISEVYNFEANYTFFSIDFINGNIGFVCGEDGNIIKITNANTLNINENILADKIKIFPIPASNIIEIKTAQKLEIEYIEIIDIRGKLIKSYKNNLEKLNISDINSGMYILRIKTENGILTTKIVIEN